MVAHGTRVTGRALTPAVVAHRQMAKPPRARSATWPSNVLAASAPSARSAQWAKSQRVAPWGSAPATPTAVCSVRRYRYQGAGPALGALYGAVNASPSTDAGQPPLRYTAATRSSVDASVTRWASPSSTRSMPG